MQGVLPAPLPNDVCKVPQFEGKEDAELFILHFLEVAQVNDWGCATELLNLRDDLKEEAKYCGRAKDHSASTSSTLWHDEKRSLQLAPNFR